MGFVFPEKIINPGFHALAETSVFQTKSGAMESLIARTVQMKQAATNAQRSENVNIHNTLWQIRPPAKDPDFLNMCARMSPVENALIQTHSPVGTSVFPLTRS